MGGGSEGRSADFEITMQWHSMRRQLQIDGELNISNVRLSALHLYIGRLNWTGTSGRDLLPSEQPSINRPSSRSNHRERAAQSSEDD